jgi:methylated-DNA-[protein]-cysteine S-methyltransferase
MPSFQRRVLELVSKIPQGRVTTYAEIARALNNPRAQRAVGNVLARNPRPLKIPCHRVVKSDGKVGGYKFGCGQKMKLLVREGIKVQKGKIDLKKYFFRFE